MNPTLRFTVPREQPGRRLDEALRDWLPPGLSRSRIRALIVAGAVRVGGRPVRRPAWVLSPGSKVQVQLPGATEPAPMPAIPILFEDEDLLVVDKPPGLPMHANLDPGRPHLVALVAALLEGRDGVPPYLGVHQRLDKDTSGVVLFTRSTRANPGVARAFEGRAVRKTYHALTARPSGALPPREWREDRPLGDPARRGGPVPVLERGGTPAETLFARLRSLPQGLLVEARPVTGRKHQVRAHLAARGLPLLGDRLYGGPVRVAGQEVPRPMLHAHRLELPHPVTGETTVFESPYPEDFRRVLEAMG